MKAKRSPNRTHYECRDCGVRINPASYRAACPECGGRLRATAAAPGRP